MRKIMLAVAIILAFASGALADKTLTYFTIVLTDVSNVCFVRTTAAPNGWVVRAGAGVRASVGNGYTASIEGNATAAQKTSIETFITNTVLPALNTQEGL